MTRRLAILLVAAVGFGGTAPASAQLTTITERFDTAASAAANGWTGFRNTADGNNFGFSNTGNVAGTPGEAGGIFARNLDNHYYADTTLGGTISRTANLTISGSFRLTNANFDGVIFVGFFNTANVTPAGESLGLILQEPNATSGTAFRGDVRVRTAAGVHSETTLFLNLAPGVTHNFSLTWTGSANGSGTLAGTIAGTNVTVNAPASTEVYNAFGIGTAMAGDNNASQVTGPCFFDNLTYSAIPEPSALALAGLSGVGFVLARLRRRRFRVY
jgi:hypothetical protein